MKTFWVLLCLLVYENTDLGGYSVLALRNSLLQDDSESIPSPQVDAGMSSEKLQELLWFFRTDKMSAWNYSILALSFMVLLIGVVLLGTTIKANKNRKVTYLQGNKHEDSQPADKEMKQGFVDLKENNNLNCPAKNLDPEVQDEDQLLVHWKDGTVTTLYPDVPKGDVEQLA